ncbi:hypothetical protein PoB_001600100 [Plakobranchus ocellatus]|uniref:Uncharacterized protein n=1 Tax=Plakobranchus ocellatus TaxID=259542 RepID=A0AAV3YQS5_9GAST|nr:hypothetical protein PoB_001600100 [Plakobranchus ocellatus]
MLPNTTRPLPHVIGYSRSNLEAGFFLGYSKTQINIHLYLSPHIAATSAFHVSKQILKQINLQNELSYVRINTTWFYIDNHEPRRLQYTMETYFKLTDSALIADIM